MLKPRHVTLPKENQEMISLTSRESIEDIAGDLGEFSAK